MGFNLWKSNAEIGVKTFNRSFTTTQNSGSGNRSTNKSTASIEFEITLSIDYENIEFVWSYGESDRGNSNYSSLGSPACTLDKTDAGKASFTLIYECYVGTKTFDKVEECWVEYTFKCTVKDSETSEEYTSVTTTFRLYAYLNAGSSGWTS